MNYSKIPLKMLNTSKKKHIAKYFLILLLCTFVGFYVEGRFYYPLSIWNQPEFGQVSNGRNILILDGVRTCDRAGRYAVNMLINKNAPKDVLIVIANTNEDVKISILESKGYLVYRTGSERISELLAGQSVQYYNDMKEIMIGPGQLSYSYLAELLQYSGSQSR